MGTLVERITINYLIMFFLVVLITKKKEEKNKKRHGEEILRLYIYTCYKLRIEERYIITALRLVRTLKPFFHLLPD